MTEANADGILTDPVPVEANWNAVQGVSPCNAQESLTDKMAFVYIRARAIILRPTRWLTRSVFSTSKSNDAGQRRGKLEGYLLYATPSTCSFPGLTILQYYSWWATGSAPRTVLIWGRTSLRSAVLGCWRRSQSASSGPTTVPSRSTRSGTLGLRFRLFVLLRDRRALFQPTVLGQFFSP